MADSGDREDFSTRLAFALKTCNLSRTQLAAALGVHKSLISRWLSGDMKPSEYNLARLSVEIAKLKPGFNMNAWAAPAADFYAALGVHDAELTAADAKENERPPPAGLRQRRWAYGLAAAIILLAGVSSGVLWQSWTGRRTPAAPPASVAVLPFVNMSGNPAEDYLGDGIAEEVLNALSNKPGLHVVARTSSFSFRDKRADIGEIARKLRVRAVLEGSVREEGGRIRIVAQLIDAEDGYHLWSARYDRKLDDVLAVQDDIASSIVAALTDKLLPAGRGSPAIDRTAYRDYLQARYLMNQRLPASLQHADALFAETLRIEPDFAAAYAARGRVLMLLADSGRDAKKLAEAAHMTDEALRRDPMNQEARSTHLQLALFAWDWSAAEHDADLIRAMPAKTAAAYNALGSYYLHLGIVRRWLDTTRQGVQIDPLSLPERFNLAHALALVEGLPQARAAALEALEIAPNHPHLLATLCTFAAEAGDLAAARRYEAEIGTQVDRSFALDCRAEQLLRSEPADRRRGAVEALLREKPEIRPADAALLYAQAGNLDKAVTLSQEAFRMRDLDLLWLTIDPRVPKALLNDPRWRAIWQKPQLREWQRVHDRLLGESAQ